MATYFQTDGGFIGVTNESPKGFKGVVFIGRGGPIDNVTEQLWSQSQLAVYKRVGIESVPDDWILALGYDEPKVEELPVFDVEGEELLDLLPVRRSPRHAPQPLDEAAHHLAQMLGLGIAAAIIILWVIFSVTN